MLAPVNNACPRRQWFSPSAEDWQTWNGEVPIVRAPTFAVGTGVDPETVKKNARDAAVAERVAAATHGNSCSERNISALLTTSAPFFGDDEEVPKWGLGYGDILSPARRSTDSRKKDVRHGLSYLAEEQRCLDEDEDDGEDGEMFFTPMRRQ